MNENMGSQVNRLREISCFSELFHDQIIAQHGCHYLFNRTFNIDDSFEFNRKNYEPLNKANLSLGRFCNETIKKLTRRGLDEVSTRNCNQLIKEWQNYSNRGGTYETYGYASTLLQILQKNKPDVFDDLRTQQVAKEFIGIPNEIKCQFHLCVSIKKRRFKSYFSQIVSSLTSKQSICEHLVEVKISKLSDSNDVHVKFLLNAKSVTNKLDPTLNEFIGLLGSVNGLNDFPGKDFFADNPIPSMTVSQGPTNYKLFLKLVKAIDEVYDRQFNFAYVK